MLFMETGHVGEGYVLIRRILDQNCAVAEAGESILAMLPDTGERYLPTFLFEDISEGSEDEWLAEYATGTN